MIAKKTYILFVALLVAVFFCSLALFAAEGKPKNAPEDKTKKTDEDKLKNADEYFRKKEYLIAKQIYKDVYLSSKEPMVLEKALWGKIKSDYRLKHYFETRQNIQRLFSMYPRTEYVYEAYLILGYIALDSKELREAKEYFKRVEGPFHEMSMVGEAELALKNGDILKAETMLSGISKKTFESEPRANYLRAMVYSKKGMHKEAVAQMNKIFETSLKEEGMRVGKAQILFDAGKLKEAEALIEKIILTPSSRNEGLEAKRILFEVYSKQGMTDEALKMSRDLFTTDAQDNFKLKVVSLYDSKGDIENALRYLIYLRDKGTRASEIEKRLKKAIASNDNRTSEYLQKYSGYLGAGSSFAVDASRYLISKGKKIEGMIILKGAMNSATKEEALLMQAELYIDEARYAEAGKILGPLTLDKRYAHRASFLLAEMLDKKGEYPLAIRYLAGIIKESRNSKAASLLGDICWKTGDRTNALTSYVLASEMGDGTSSVKAGDIYYLSGNTKKAVFYYGRLLKSDRKPTDNQSLQWAEYQYGKLTNNRDYLKKAVSGGGEIAEAASALLGE